VYFSLFGLYIHFLIGDDVLKFVNVDIDLSYPVDIGLLHLVQILIILNFKVDEFFFKLI